MRRWLGVVLAIAACKGKAEEKKPVVAAPAVVAVGSGSAAGSAVAAPTKKTLSKAQLADYRKHMKAAWALQKQQQWAESVPELEAALKAVDGDQRALAELGWSAMNAGDFKKARRADDQAVRVALDPKVKAAALFNLGMVEAKTGNVDDARQSFTASLKLRPNKTVEAELGKLGAAPAEEKPFCGPKEDPCACVRQASFPDFDPTDPPDCTAEKETGVPVPTFKAYTVKQAPWSYTYLLDERQDLVAMTAMSLDRTRVYEDMSIDKAEVKTLGSHRVLWLQTKDSAREDEPKDDDSIDTSGDDRIAVTLCVLADDKTPTHCPLRDVPLSHHAWRDSEHTDATTITDLALASDGTATVKLVSGPSDHALDAVLGPTKLW
ncbi:MAG TPA: tetratricopeptide repeat protein [Kofleriaceae bacterium]|nr:tetratricopeptide repeat protein [Kofleriaceae bacterium]